MYTIQNYNVHGFVEEFVKELFPSFYWSHDFVEEFVEVLYWSICVIVLMETWLVTVEIPSDISEEEERTVY